MRNMTLVIIFLHYTIVEFSRSTESTFSVMISIVNSKIVTKLEAHWAHSYERSELRLCVDT